MALVVGVATMVVVEDVSVTVRIAVVMTVSHIVAVHAKGIVVDKATKKIVAAAVNLCMV